MERLQRIIVDDTHYFTTDKYGIKIEHLENWNYALNGDTYSTRLESDKAVLEISEQYRLLMIQVINNNNEKEFINLTSQIKFIFENNLVYTLNDIINLYTMSKFKEDTLKMGNLYIKFKNYILKNNTMIIDINFLVSDKPLI